MAIRPNYDNKWSKYEISTDSGGTFEKLSHYHKSFVGPIPNVWQPEMSGAELAD